MRVRIMVMAVTSSVAVSLVAAAPTAGAAPETPSPPGTPDLTISRPQVSTDAATRGEVSVVISNVGTAAATGVVAYTGSFPVGIAGTQLIPRIGPGESVRRTVGRLSSTPFIGLVNSSVYLDQRDPQPLNNYSITVEVLRRPR